jgi:hypothetical protein
MAETAGQPFVQIKRASSERDSSFIVKRPFPDERGQREMLGGAKNSIA